jgi:hypothetical protein
MFIFLLFKLDLMVYLLCRKLDLELETSASKVMKEERTEVFRPVHINMILCSELSADMFMTVSYW